MRKYRLIVGVEGDKFGHDELTGANSHREARKELDRAVEPFGDVIWGRIEVNDSYPDLDKWERLETWEYRLGRHKKIFKK